MWIGWRIQPTSLEVWTFVNVRWATNLNNTNKSKPFLPTPYEMTFGFFIVQSYIPDRAFVRNSLFFSFIGGSEETLGIRILKIILYQQSASASVYRRCQTGIRNRALEEGQQRVSDIHFWMGLFRKIRILSSKKNSLPVFLMTFIITTQLLRITKISL